MKIVCNFRVGDLEQLHLHFKNRRLLTLFLSHTPVYKSIPVHG